VHGTAGGRSGGDSARPEPRTQTPDAPGHPRRWWALAVIDLCLLAVTMDNTILNIALPTIARQLGSTGSQLQWMVDAYIVAFAGLLLTSGTLGDRLGRRKLMVAGLAIFGLGSAATLLVTTSDQLIALRGLMGLGASLLMPATLSIITNIFPANERPKAIATWAAVSGVGMVAGPIIGGGLLENFAWNSIFIINIPIVLVGVAGTLALMPESRDANPGRTDPVGAVLSIAGLTTLVYAIIEAPNAGWTAPETFVRIGLGLVVMAAFITWELHYHSPMFDLGLFARPAFGATSFAETVAHFALVGGMFGLTQYLQFVWGLRPMEAGFAMLPIAIGVIAGSMVAARLLPRFGVRPLLVAGMLGLSVGLLLLSRLEVSTSYPLFAAMLLCLSLGMGLAMAPATDSIMGAVDKDKAGVGSATNDTTRELGSALGVAVFGSIISSGYRDGLTSGLANMPGGLAGLPPAISDAIHDSIGSASIAAGHLPSPAGDAVLSAARASFVSGMSTATLIGAAVIAAGALLLAHWLPGRARDVAPAEAHSATAESTLEIGAAGA
jgi:EmrB/QacA subfamily drug resistance transporter